MRTLLPTLLLLSSLCAPLSAQCPITVDAGPDVWLCQAPGSAQLNGAIYGPYLNFSWSPTTGMQGANTLNPTVTVNGPATYVLTGRAVNLNNNLITNGDFEGGNFGFTSDYTYSPTNLVPEGTYAVLPNPQTAHPGFAPCGDHTSGSGNMMAVNGAGTPNQNVWCQTVTIQPNTQYVFSAWVTSLHPSSPARLQFSINGNTIGPIFTAPSTTCTWLNFYTTWNSGANTSATICIVNQNTTLGGNDFAIDDIVFSPVCTVTDTVRVHVVQLQAVAAPAISVIPCEGSPITLNGTGSSTGPNITYRWETANGNIVSGETTLQPVVNSAGSYTLVVTFNNGFVECRRTATVNVILTNNPLTVWITPPPPLGCGNNSVQLRGFTNQPAFARYQWSAGPGGQFTTKPDSAVVWVNRPGVYTLTVTNTMTGCTATATATVTAATEPPVVEANASISAFFCTSDTFQLSGNGSSTGPNFTYAWTALQGGRIVSGADSIRARANAPGMYILQVTNTTNGCSMRDTVVVQDRRALPVFSIDTPAVYTCATDTLRLRGRIDSGAVRVVWRVLDGPPLAGDTTLLEISALGPGRYTLTAIDTVNACVATDTVVVVADTAAPVAVVEPPALLTCTQPEVTLSGSGSSEGPAFAYRWTAAPGGNFTSADTLLTARVNAPGTYFLQVINTANGCTAIASVEVNADADVIVAVANAPDILTCARTQVSLNANGSSPTPGLQYAWTTANGLLLSGANTPAPVVGAPGTYVLRITNPANGCTASDQVVVQQDTAAPPIHIAAPDTLTCVTTEVVLFGQNPAAGTFQYQWTASAGGRLLHGEQTLTPVANAAGVYTLIARNVDNGCTAVRTVLVAIDTAAPLAHLAPALSLTCASPVRLLDGSASSSGPAFSHTWTASNGGRFIGNTHTLTPSVDAAGLYTLTVLNTQNGCSQSASVTVGIDTIRPPADAGPDGVLTCAHPVFSLSANAGQAGPHQYQWQTADGAFAGSPNAAAVGAVQAGTYVLRVIDPQNGCISTDTVRLTADQEAPQPTFFVSHPKITCFYHRVVLQVTNPQPHWQMAWTTVGGNFVTRPDSEAVWINGAGEYRLLLTNTQNGCTTERAFNIGVDTLRPKVSIQPHGFLSCTAPAIVLTAVVQPDSGFTFYWWRNDVSGTLNWTTLQPTAIEPANYSLQVTLTRNGCTAVAHTSLNANWQKPFVTAGKDTTLSCLHQQISLSGAAFGFLPPTVVWTAAAGGNIVSGANTFKPVVNAPGIYTMTATDPYNGCSDSSQVRVLADQNAPTASIALPDTLTCARTQIVLQGSGSPSGVVSAAWAAVAGGNIVSGSNSFAPAVNAPGRYVLTVTNPQNGCTATAERAVVQDITPPALQTPAPPLLTCAAPSALLRAAPDTAAYAYEWQTLNGNIVSGQQSAQAAVDRPGAYTIVVTDRRTGCTSVRTVSVAADQQSPQIGIAAPPVLTCSAPQAILQATVAGVPAGSVNAQWNTANGLIVAGAQGLTPTVAAPGTYALTVQNTLNGCTASQSVQVAQNIAAPTARISAPAAITCAQRQVALDASASSGQGVLSFTWAGGLILSGQGTPTPTLGQPGAYALTLTDAANGCTAVASVIVPADTVAPVPRLAPTLPLTCDRLSVVIDAAASSGQTPLLAQWTTANGNIASGANTLTPNVNAPGVYVLLLTNGPNGCTASAATTVQEDRTPPEANAGPDQTLYCLQPEVALSGQSSTPGPLTYQWTAVQGGPLAGNAASAQTTTRSPGTYRLTVTRLSNGCTASDEARVAAIEPPVFVPRIEQPNCHRSTGNIAFTGLSGGQPPLRYSVNGGQTFGPSPQFSGLAPGAYTLVVSDALGCTASATAGIDPPFFPKISFATVAPVDLGDSIRLEPVLNLPASQVADWQWTPAEGLSCDDCPAPWASPLRTTRYRLRILDADGCPAEAHVLVPISRRRLLYAPNIFSPNGDGQNDRFTLYGNQAVVSIRSLQVFDRWGNLVFSGQNLRPNDESAGWDGSFRGQSALPGVYVWQAVVAFLDGVEEAFAGDVTIAP
ncbi:MAG: gliding motility-associated C-terminal domain-containing protein [Saprospiraceae bacterium]|nr:gliding motility-associated C-terminal domain-containing protein [Saprospiraceae bacterium]